MNHKPKPMDQVHEAMRARHYSRRTEEAYVQWIKRFIFRHATSGAMGGEEVVRDSKERRDRHTMLPQPAVPLLSISSSRPMAIYDGDLRDGFGSVWIPEGD